VSVKRVHHLDCRTMCPRIGYVNDHTRFVSKFKAEWPLTARLTTVLQNAHTSFSDDSPATRPITGEVQRSAPAPEVLLGAFRQ
jgi:hypothetical protein